MIEIKKILVVDDNPDVVFSVVDGLKAVAPNYEFLEASNGAEALIQLKKKKADLVLLDIMMPEMDGWTAAAKMKEDPKTKKIPIVFLTAKTDEMSKGMGSLAAEDYVEKPFKIEDLHKRIKKVLKE